MKNLLVVCLILSVVNMLNAQEYMKIHQKDGTARAIQFSSVDSITFEKLQSTDLVDIDGNVYHTVVIGTQVWMAENLRTTKYRDGTPITRIDDPALWTSTTTGAYCEYENKPINGYTYGYLYNRQAVADSKNLAPDGWHIPTESEWLTMINSAENGSAVPLVKAELWGDHSSPNPNSTGFSALPGGRRINQGVFDGLGWLASWWTRSTKYNKGCFLTITSVFAPTFNQADNNYGLSVRCVKD